MTSRWDGTGPSPRMTPAGWRILDALFGRWKWHKAEARIKKARFIDWTYHRPTRREPLSALRRLIALGLVQPCCRAENGTGHVRLTSTGLVLVNRKR